MGLFGRFAKGTGSGVFFFGVVLLTIEFLDELVFGAREAAWPLIRSDLGLSYAQVGLLLGVPGVIGNMIELPLGVLGDVGGNFGFGATANRFRISEILHRVPSGRIRNSARQRIQSAIALGLNPFLSRFWCICESLASQFNGFKPGAT